jgi:Holliday junction DNA helicase RuvA
VVRRGTDSDEPRALAHEGLLGLGFQPAEADEMLEGVNGETPEELLAEALRAVA